MRKTLLYMIGSVLLLTSCHYKDLEEELVRHNVDVEFLWHEQPDATPEGMLMHVWAADMQPLVIPFSDVNGGPTTLMADNYQLVAWNDKTLLQTRGDSYGDFEIYSLPQEVATFSAPFATNRSMPRALGTENQPSIMQPDSCQTAAIPLFTVEEGRSAHIVFTMHEATKTYRFVVRDAEHMSFLKEVFATLSGMSGSWLPAAEQCTDTECVIPFEMSHVDGEPAVEGGVRAFGHCPNGDLHQHLLTVYAVLQNGQQYYFVFDVTEQMHDGSHTGDGTDQPIIIETLPSPTPIEDNGGGFQPDVDEWDDIEQDIDLAA